MDSTDKDSSSPNTRERLLDISEQLFAQHGVGSVSIRSINTAAKLSPGILHYHFGNKDTLLEAIIARRMDEITSSRNTLISQLAFEKTPSTTTIAKLLVKPLADFVLGKPQHGQPYVKLIARLYADRSPILEAVSQRYHQADLETLLTLTQAACPHLSTSQVIFRLGLAKHTLLQSACEWFGPPRTWQKNETLTSDEKVAELIIFIAAGLAA